MEIKAKANMVRYVQILWLIFSLIIPTADAASSLMIDGNIPTTGNINIRIVQSSDNPYGGTLMFETNIPAGQVQGAVALPDLPEGAYRIRVFADANGDGVMNSNAFGVPTESVSRVDISSSNEFTRVRMEQPPADPRAWGVGVMTLYSSNPYRGGDTVFRVLPLVTYVGEKLYVVGPSAGYNLVKNRWISANVVARYIFSGDAFDDSPYLDGMDERKDTLMSGFNLNLRGIGKWRMEFSALTDVLGRHDGQELDISAGYQFRGNRWSLSPTAGMFWRSADYNDYYYGVRTGEETEERPAYAPGSSFEFFAGLFARVEINDRWSVLASIRGEVLSDEIQDSPIVDKDFVNTTFLGLNYAF